MALEEYVTKGGRRMRCGFTSGTCAALAAGAAAEMLLSGKPPAVRTLVTPKGVAVEAEILDAKAEGDSARCAVKKDAGDDPDATDGMLVYAAVRKIPGGTVTVDGGAGVGRVTRPGLEQPVGAAAINAVPRRMIEAEVGRVREAHGYDGGLEVVVSIPDGEKIAARTFNPLLGIVGGLSVIGTSGIVEPMSERALIDTIEVEMRMRRAENAVDLVMVPGNYGEAFLRSSAILQGRPLVKCSNFIGEALDLAAMQGFEKVLLVGHIGKLIKVAGGIMNTHSKIADCRMELLAAHAALCGADGPAVRRVMDAATVDDGIAALDGYGLREAVMGSVLERIEWHMRRRVGDACAVGALLFSNRYGRLGMTKSAEAILGAWERSDG